MTSQTIATFTAADERTVESFRRKFPRQADNMLRLAVVAMARDGLYDSTARVLAARVAVLEAEKEECKSEYNDLSGEFLGCASCARDLKKGDCTAETPVCRGYLSNE